MRSLRLALTTALLAAAAEEGLGSDAIAAASSLSIGAPRVTDVDDDGRPFLVLPELIDWGSNARVRRDEAEMSAAAKERAAREQLEREAAAGGEAGEAARAELARRVEELRLGERERRVADFVRTKVRVEVHFRKMDLDSNGQLNLTELATPLAKIGKKAKEIAKIHAGLDTNEDKVRCARRFLCMCARALTPSLPPPARCCGRVCAPLDERPGRDDAAAV